MHIQQKWNDNQKGEGREPQSCSSYRDMRRFFGVDFRCEAADSR